LYAFDSFKYFGIDVWQVKSGTIFGNFLLTDDWDTAKEQIDEINANREGEKKLKEEADAKEKAEREAREAEEAAKKEQEQENEEDDEEDDDKEDDDKEDDHKKEEL